MRNELYQYFQLSTDLGLLQRQWSSQSGPYARSMIHGRSVRCLSIDEFEALISFVGSANNNIKRNTKMLRSLCAHFPHNLVAHVDGGMVYCFPTLDEVATLSVDDLEEMGWGYRAGRVVSLCSELSSMGGLSWLKQLRDSALEDATQRLMMLSGVGPKVADCIALFGLGHHSAVPLDNRVAKMHRYNGPYEQLKQQFQNKYGIVFCSSVLTDACVGIYAGWAAIGMFASEYLDLVV